MVETSHFNLTCSLKRKKFDFLAFFLTLISYYSFILKTIISIVYKSSWEGKCLQPIDNTSFTARDTGLSRSLIWGLFFPLISYRKMRFFLRHIWRKNWMDFWTEKKWKNGHEWPFFTNFQTRFPIKNLIQIWRIKDFLIKKFLRKITRLWESFWPILVSFSRAFKCTHLFALKPSA